MKIDYSAFLSSAADGRIWWQVEDAIKLASGYLPEGDQRGPVGALRAPNNRVLSIERMLTDAFGEDRLPLMRPEVFVRDGARVVEAHRFMAWLAQYVALTQPEIPFPDELARELGESDCVQQQDAGPPTQFASLTTVLEGRFEDSLSELTDSLRERVKRDFFPMDWDDLAPDQRRSVARQWDQQNDPATEAERRRAWDFVVQMEDLKAQIAKWENVAAPTAGELAQQEARVETLRQRLDRMEQQLRSPRGCNDPERTHLHARATPIDGGDAPATAESDAVEAGRRVTAPSAAGRDQCSIFRQMAELRPDEMRISFVGDTSESGLSGNNMLEITARGETRRMALAEFDLIDRRNGALTQQAAVLVGLTRGKAFRRDGNKHSATMARLRKTFRERLGITTDPFTRYDKGAGWQPRFSITDQRGKADERARAIAERKTTSLDQLMEAGWQFSGRGSAADAGGEDMAEAWLKEHDPLRRT